jgi:hypothetical protein
MRQRNITRNFNINPLNSELNPMCHLLALVEAHPIFRVSRIRVNNTTEERGHWGDQDIDKRIILRWIFR